MKIAICAIAKDEEKNVDSFMASCKEADCTYVGVDIRSSDNTAERLQELGAIIIPVDLSPWDFGKARNIVLNAIPNDVNVCVSLDLDETFNAGWRKILEEEWEPELSTLIYKFIYAWEDDAQTIPGLIIQGFKIYERNSYIWQNPVHENIKFIGETQKVKYTDKIIAYHHPDIKKDRPYLELIQSAIKLDPTNPWLVYLDARQNFTGKNYEDCANSCVKYLNMTNAYEGNCVTMESRSECCRMMARCHFFINPVDLGEGVTWMLRAVSENQNERENWVYLGEAWAMFGNKVSAKAAIVNAISITNPIFSSQKEERCWDDAKLKKFIEELEK